MAMAPRTALLAASALVAAALITESFDHASVTGPTPTSSGSQPRHVFTHSASLRSVLVAAKPGEGTRCLVIAERGDMSATNLRTEALGRSAEAGASRVYRPPPTGLFQEPLRHHVAVIARSCLSSCHWSNGLSSEEHPCAL